MYLTTKIGKLHFKIVIKHHISKGKNKRFRPSQRKLQTLLPEIKENLNNWRDIPHSWTEKLNIKIFFLLKFC